MKLENLQERLDISVPLLHSPSPQDLAAEPETEGKTVQQDSVIPNALINSKYGGINSTHSVFQRQEWHPCHSVLQQTRTDLHDDEIHIYHSCKAGKGQAPHL